MKKNFLYIVIIITLLILLTISNYSLNNSRKKYAMQKPLIESLTKNLVRKKKYQGNLVSKKTNKLIESYKDYMITNQLSLHIILVVDTIDCYSCFKFHMDELNKLDIRKICFTKNQNNVRLITTYNKEIVFGDFNKTFFEQNDLFFENMAIALVDDSTRVEGDNSI